MSNPEAVARGHLYIVATPIGNLADLSPRAAAVLAGVDLILAEDTRNSRVLMQHMGINTPMSALHDHNERGAAGPLIKRLESGESLALISDAGTPLISDPGFVLVRQVRDAGLPVMAVPGPSALIAALSIAGLPTDRFLFIGFLPAKTNARRTTLAPLQHVPETWVCYESSHRIEECLGDIEATLGPERIVFLARELTKRFEQSIRLPIRELRAWLAADPVHCKGEFVLCIAGAEAQDDDARQLAEGRRLMVRLRQELPTSKAARLAAELSGAPRKQLYDDALADDAAE
jgi:16S rRNA (cytidine1402-2'-O)-methyltransferase